MAHDAHVFSLLVNALQTLDTNDVMGRRMLAMWRDAIEMAQTDRISDMRRTIAWGAASPTPMVWGAWL